MTSSFAKVLPEGKCLAQPKNKDIFATENPGDEPRISALKRCHDNLGHPSHTRLISMLQSANASETTIRLAKELTCPMCRMKDNPPAKPVARIKKAWEFNLQIMIDEPKIKTAQNSR